MNTHHRRAPLPALLSLGLLLGTPAIAEQRPQANGHSARPDISRTGRFVAFDSEASNLVAADANGTRDVFVRDRRTGRTLLASRRTAGEPGDALSSHACLAADGSAVGFMSVATNLVAGDTNGQPDIFVHDLRTSRTSRVSVAGDGSQAAGESRDCAVSADGRFVAFTSTAENLVADDTNRAADVFLHDRSTGRTTRVSLGRGGRQADAASWAPALSHDGTTVAFLSHATNIVEGDRNALPDVFVRDLRTRRTWRVSVATDGTEGDWHADQLDLAGNGRHVAFETWARNLDPLDADERPDVYVHDLRRGRTTLVSRGANGSGDGHCVNPVLDFSGRRVAYESLATNIVERPANAWMEVFVHDRRDGTTERASLAPDGQQGSDDCGEASLSANGRWLAFAAKAKNLVPGDTNRKVDIFVRDLRRGRTERVSGPSDAGPARAAAARTSSR